MPDVKLVKVPSRVNIIGNKEADRLADLGRLSHLQCPIITTPAKEQINVFITPLCKKHKLTAPHELQDVAQVLQFSPVHHAPSDAVSEVWMDLTQRLDPELLEGDWSPPPTIGRQYIRLKQHI
jgi:hypothetical protein